MSEENKEIVRRSYEHITAGDIDAFDSYFASDLVYHGTGGMEIRGVDGLKEMARMYISAFSELKTKIHDQASEGDKVWTRASHVGTHTGELMGIAPTGKGISIGSMSVHRMAGGKIVEMWDFTDEMGMMQQLGVIPAPGTES